VPTPEDYLAIAFARQVTTVLGRPNRARLAPLVDALARGDLEPIIQATYPLADAEEAHRVSKAGKVVGKLLLVP
jgi:NADPH:quinone reductase-like Zn-dependent oxidoreductase